MDLIYISQEPRNHPTKVNLRRKVCHLRQPSDKWSSWCYLQLGPFHLPLRPVLLEAGPFVPEELEAPRDVVLSPSRTRLRSSDVPTTWAAAAVEEDRGGRQLIHGLTEAAWFHSVRCWGPFRVRYSGGRAGPSAAVYAGQDRSFLGRMEQMYNFRANAALPPWDCKLKVTFRVDHLWLWSDTYIIHITMLESVSL